jgi:metal-responsive CopG/Arc/MetJ family transcriptional regulator
MSKILINIPGELLEEVDHRAREEKMTRSEAIRLALREWMRTRNYVAPNQRPGFCEIEKRMRAAAESNQSGITAEALIRKERESH